METAFQTDCGKVREHNEDSGGLFYNQKGGLLAVVADGMGGHRAGDVASALALDFLKEQWEQTAAELQKQEAQSWLSETIQEANHHVKSYADEHPECEGMGTTVVAALCAPGFTVIAHVGDSRGYLLAEEAFNQVTRDHSLVNELVQRGDITEQEAAVHPQKHVVLQALGTEGGVAPETAVIDWQPGQMILLCSDGLTDCLPIEKIEKMLRSEQSLQEKADAMVEEANGAGGIDNITLALVRAPREQKPPLPEQTQVDEDAASQEASVEGSSAAKEGSK